MSSKVERLRRHGERISDHAIASGPGLAGHITLVLVENVPIMKLYSAGDVAVQKPIQITGTCFYAGYAYDEGLMLDLCGSVDDDGYHVESIAVAGITVEIAQLLNARQSEHMGMWLALKDGSPAQLGWSDRHKHDGCGIQQLTVNIGSGLGWSATRQPMYYP